VATGRTGTLEKGSYFGRTLAQLQPIGQIVGWWSTHSAFTLPCSSSSLQDPWFSFLLLETSPSTHSHHHTAGVAVFTRKGIPSLDLSAPLSGPSASSFKMN
jgi:hypothetical protein